MNFMKTIHDMFSSTPDDENEKEQHKRNGGFSEVVKSTPF